MFANGCQAMDLDSRNKRASAIGYDFNWVHVYPNPGTTVNEQYRSQIAMKYAGSLSASTATGGNFYYRTLLYTGF